MMTCLEKDGVMQPASGTVIVIHAVNSFQPGGVTTPERHSHHLRSGRHVPGGNRPKDS